uniref:Uncharacterized protein n=1 Tax=Chryseobacterium endophyticum TaxID=1854762 RepID=A0AAU6WPS0_9FLAO
MKKYIIPVMVALSVLSCSKKEADQKPQAKKGFELSNTMLKSIDLAKVEKNILKTTIIFTERSRQTRTAISMCIRWLAEMY